MLAFMKRIISVNMRKLFFPFVSVMTGVIVAYSFLNWLFILGANKFVFNLVWVETWFPILVAACIARFWVIPKLRNINFIIDRHKNLLVPLIAFFILAVTLHFSQIWVESYYAKIQHLNRINEVNLEPKRRFYEITHGYYIDKALISYYNHEYKCCGRQPEHFSEIYVVYPIYKEKNEIKHDVEPTAWLGVLFDGKRMSRSSQEEFFIQTMKHLEKLVPNTFYYLERKTNSNMIQDESLERFQSAIHNGHYVFTTPSNPLILIAHYHPFAKRMRDDKENALGVWIFAVLVWFGVVYLLIDEAHSPSKNS